MGPSEAMSIGSEPFALSPSTGDLAGARFDRLRAKRSVTFVTFRPGPHPMDVVTFVTFRTAARRAAARFALPFAHFSCDIGGSIE